MSSTRSETHNSHQPEQWTVWRIDDNSNTFAFSEHLDQQEAERLVADFTARGHKQLYWAKREINSVELSHPSD